MRSSRHLPLLAMLLLFASSTAHAKRETPFKPVTGAFWALSVADLAASRNWYAEKFGLEITLDIPEPSGVSVAVLEGSGLIVELLQHATARPLALAAPGVTDVQSVHGIVKVGLIVKDFDGVVAELRMRGVEIAYGPVPAANGQRANVIVRDNSGNLIQFFGE